MRYDSADPTVSLFVKTKENQAGQWTVDITWKLVKNGTKSAFMNNILGFDNNSFWDKNNSHFGITIPQTMSCVCVCKPCTN